MKCWVCKKKIKISFEFPTWEKNETEIKMRDYCEKCISKVIFDDCGNIIGIKKRGVYGRKKTVNKDNYRK